jgi:drug/metabolite transporter (DMT)-like permease
LLGGAIGFVFFGALGAAIGATYGEELDPFHRPSTSADAAAGALIGAVAGFGIGVVIGSRFKSDRWVEAEFPSPPPVTLNVGKDGSVRLAISLRL